MSQKYLREAKAVWEGALQQNQRGLGRDEI